MTSKIAGDSVTTFYGQVVSRFRGLTSDEYRLVMEPVTREELREIGFVQEGNVWHSADGLATLLEWTELDPHIGLLDRLRLRCELLWLWMLEPGYQLDAENYSAERHKVRYNELKRRQAEIRAILATP